MKYETILNSLAEVIEVKNEKIMLLEWEVESLKKRLKEAELAAIETTAKNSSVLCGKRIEVRKED